MEALGSTDLNLLLDVSFNREVGQDCALYWTKENGSLAKLIDEVDEMSGEEILELGRAAKKRVTEQYSWERICEQYEEVFTRC